MNLGKNYTVIWKPSMVFAIIWFALSVGLTSCSSAKRGASNAYKPLEPSLLWEVSGKGLKHKSYVFGTIHIIPADKFFWTDVMEQHFNKADLIVFELDVNEMNDMGAMMGLMQHLFMQNDTTLSDLLTKTEYDRVSAHLQKFGLPMFMFERMKPFFITVFMSEDFSQGALQDGSLQSYEMVLNEKAQKAGKPTRGLETIEFQASIFDKIPYKDQAKMLLDMVDSDTQEDDSQLDRLVKMYMEQDLEGLGSAVGDSEEMPSDWEAELLTLRNKNWIDLMIPMMKSQSVFFAVGAAHLPGEEGVLHLLRQKGYTIKALK